MQPRPLHREDNPLASEDPRDWDRLIQALGESSLLVVIERRMSRSLRAKFEPEDVFQEALLMIWRDRSKMEWCGLHAFRRLFLQVVNYRILDMVDFLGARKRGGDDPPPLISELAREEGEGGAFLGKLQSTTPSRVAIQREEARAMRAALDRLPAELSEVVYLRLFEGLSTSEVADRLSLGISAVKHRLRKGSAEYRQNVRDEFAEQSRGASKVQ